jgi:hypothetical protein
LATASIAIRSPSAGRNAAPAHARVVSVLPLARSSHAVSKPEHKLTDATPSVEKKKKFLEIVRIIITPKFIISVLNFF